MGLQWVWDDCYSIGVREHFRQVRNMETFNRSISRSHFLGKQI